MLMPVPGTRSTILLLVVDRTCIVPVCHMQIVVCRDVLVEYWYKYCTVIDGCTQHPTMLSKSKNMAQSDEGRQCQ